MGNNRITIKLDTLKRYRKYLADRNEYDIVFKVDMLINYLSNKQSGE